MDICKNPKPTPPPLPSPFSSLFLPKTKQMWIKIPHTIFENKRRVYREIKTRDKGVQSTLFVTM